MKQIKFVGDKEAFVFRLGGFVQPGETREVTNAMAKFLLRSDQFEDVTPKPEAESKTKISKNEEEK